jgi:hypothetical protein
MPPKSGSQKRKEKIKNDLELKKIRGSLDKFILPRSNRKYIHFIFLY